MVMKNRFELKGDIAIVYCDTKLFIIDSIMLPKLMEVPNSWYFDKYVYTFIKGKKVYLHRYLTGAEKGQVVDHLEGNPYDNRLEKLRLGGYRENNQNRKGLDSHNTSGYRNVTWDKKNEKWEVRISVNGKNKFIGRFESIDIANKEAIKARQKYMPYLNEVKS
jgi:hypothetical protein